MRTGKEDFYLSASRMVPYKRMDLIVEAFASMPERRLVVIGDGPQMATIRAKATPNVTIMGYQPFEVLKDHMQRARAFVFAAEEDFGIAVLEAQACGTPVIAYGKGGALETVIPPGAAGASGMHFGEQSVAALQTAIQTFEAQIDRFSPHACRANAERFSPAIFRRAFMMEVMRAIAAQNAVRTVQYPDDRARLKVGS
jgi:glycosyltransferase involved in cell wall biosynthesis